MDQCNDHTRLSASLILGIPALVLIHYSGLELSFWLSVLVKALPAALTIPVMKQLYIPTTKNVRYKAQALIQGLGYCLPKVVGPLVIGSSLFFAGIAVWLVVALYLGRTYQKAVDTNKIVC